MRSVRLISSLGLLMLSLVASAALSALVLDWMYAETYHEVLASGIWPVDAYRYNEDLRNFEMTPALSKPLLDGRYYLKTHALGYRVPEAAPMEGFRPGGLLSIGCSFTFGDEVEAEQTFTHRAAESLGLDAYNYGVCSYSYASSILQLEDLERRGVLRELAPSVLVLGGGLWLIGRSATPFYPTPDMQLAYPYIALDAGAPTLRHPPDLISVRHAIGFATRSSYFDGEERAVPLDLHRRLLLLRTIPRVLIAKVRQRAFQNDIRPDQLHAFVLERISAVAERIGARLVVLNMPVLRDRGSFDAGLRQAVEACDCATFVDGYQALVDHGALDARLAHPDARAHAAYASAIVAALETPRRELAR